MRFYEHYLARLAKFYMKLIVILYIMLPMNDSYAFTRIKHMELIILSVEDEEDKIN